MADEYIREAMIRNPTSGTGNNWGAGTSPDKEITTTSTSYVLCSTTPITVLNGGTFTCRWTHKTIATGTSTTRIYKNGVAFGVEKTNNTTSYSTETDILSFSTGDIVELYHYDAGGLSTSYVKNMTLRAGRPQLG